MTQSKTIHQRAARQRRIRAKAKHISPRLRLHVYRSNRYIYAQIIDDQAGKTLVAVSEKELKKPATTKTQRSGQVGQLLATKAKTKKINQVKFDRGWYKYHGRIKSLAEAARESGLKF